jgi:hypothetical protein
LIRVTKTADGKLQREQLLPVRFVPMTGEAAKGSKTEEGEKDESLRKEPATVQE